MTTTVRSWKSSRMMHPRWRRRANGPAVAPNYFLYEAQNCLPIVLYSVWNTPLSTDIFGYWTKRNNVILMAMNECSLQSQNEGKTFIGWWTPPTDCEHLHQNQINAYQGPNWPVFPELGWDFQVVKLCFLDDFWQLKVIQQLSNHERLLSIFVLILGLPFQRKPDQHWDVLSLINRVFKRTNLQLHWAQNKCLD